MAPPKAATSPRAGLLEDPELRRRIACRIRALWEDSVEVEDLLQETLARAHKGLPRFRGESSLTTWALSIAENVVRDRRRRAAARPIETRGSAGENYLESIAVDAGPNPEEETERRLSAECIQGTLKTLPESYRKAVELHDLQGLENPEIARRLGLPVSTVKIRVHRARRRLRGACKDDCEPYTDARGNVGCRPRNPKPGLS